jgi:lipoprotein signal peptidase
MYISKKAGALLLLFILTDQITRLSITFWRPDWISNSPVRWFNALPGIWSWVLAVILLDILRRAYFRKPEYELALSLLGAGTMSNLITFLVMGRVVDYIPLVSTVINIADLYIIVGILLLLAKYVQTWYAAPTNGVD